MNVPIPVQTATPTKDKRVFEWAWTMKKDAVEAWDGMLDSVVSLYVSHDKDRKLYRARISTQRTGKRNGFSVTQFDLFGETSAVVDVASVARYSAKSFDEFARGALRLVNDKLHQGDEKVKAVFLSAADFGS